MKHKDIQARSEKAIKENSGSFSSAQDESAANQMYCDVANDERTLQWQFMEWASKYGWMFGGINDLWYNGKGSIYKTQSELFEIFLTETNRI